MVKVATKSGPLESVQYDAREDRLKLVFAGDRVLDVPRKSIDELRGLSARELAMLQPDNAGMTISQRERDIDIYVHGLLHEAFSLLPAAALGRKGGSRKSPAKKRASAANGAKGGRPKKKHSAPKD